jgi:hypothetical protein
MARMSSVASPVRLGVPVTLALWLEGREDPLIYRAAGLPGPEGIRVEVPLTVAGIVAEFIAPFGAEEEFRHEVEQQSRLANDGLRGIGAPATEELA